MPTCAPMPAASPPLPQRASSSASTASWRCPPPWPPYSSGYFRPRKPTPASLANTSSGNQRSASHCSAWGRSSAAMKRRIESRSSSCSSVNGGVAGIAARTYLDTCRFAWYTGSRRDPVCRANQSPCPAALRADRVAARRRRPLRRAGARRAAARRARARAAPGRRALVGARGDRRAAGRRRRRDAPRIGHLRRRRAAARPRGRRGRRVAQRAARGARAHRAAHRRARRAAGRSRRRGRAPARRDGERQPAVERRRPPVPPAPRRADRATRCSPRSPSRSPT